MRILVTGGAGFLGANLCHRLYAMGHKFIACDNLSFGKIENTEGVYPLLKCDFKEIPQSSLDNFDVLIHLATSNMIYAMEHPIETIRNNAIKTTELFANFKGKIIYTSTASVYGNANNLPTKESDEIKLSSPYATSKYISELFLRERGDFTTLRLSNVYGRFQDEGSPYCGVLGKFIDKYLAEKPLTIYGSGIATRDYTYVEDTIDAIIKAIELPVQNTEINIATGIETSVMQLSEMIDSNNKQDYKIELCDYRSIDNIQRRCLDISLAEKLLGWKPQTNIREGIDRLIEIKKNK